ncbi:MAG: PQQ-dependent dehydrogenase, methanol/ethanol family [Vicinamibacterales bacterium]
MTSTRPFTFSAAMLATVVTVTGSLLRAQQPAPPMPSVLRAYTAVTPDRLTKPAEGDWLMNRRTYDGWGFSPLSQITPANVARLQPVWSFATGVNLGHEAPPLVNNGVMFVATPQNQVIAVDARSGAVLWRYRNPAPENLILLHPTSRGVALWGDKVLFARAESVLVALDAKTGREVWSAIVEDNRKGYYMSLAPLVARGVVMVGASGGELGVRGFVAGYDVETGKPLWKTYTVPAPGEPGSETWPSGDEWKTGGGSIWVTANYDVETNLAYWGTGNGGPWMGDKRPGDNLYTSSTIAIDVATGQIKGHFQYTPNESWDWDEVSPPVLIDFQRNDRTVRGLVNVARNGYLWFLERTRLGPIRYVDATNYVKQNVFKSIDPKSGRPDVDPTRKPGTGRSAEFCPSIWGGKNWPPIAFSPRTRLIYIPANENLCASILGREATYKPGAAYVGATTNVAPAPGATHFGEVQAWNVDTGKRVWTHTYATSPNWGPVLATAGGLVFSGGTNDRKFHAFDAQTGKLLWEFPTPSGIIGQPSTFLLDGTQYVAVQSGWAVDAKAMQARLNAAFPGRYPEVPEGGSIWVFALK